jgi:hypothetical protein
MTELFCAERADKSPAALQQRCQTTHSAIVFLGDVVLGFLPVQIVDLIAKNAQRFLEFGYGRALYGLV